MQLPKPPSCFGCTLHDDPKVGTHQGYVPPVGPTSSSLLFLGEAAGEEETFQGEPFVGAAGTLLNRSLGMRRMERGGIRIGNVLSCRPPDNRLERTPWEHSAIASCRSRYLDPMIEEWLAGGTPPTTVTEVRSGSVADDGTLTGPRTPYEYTRPVPPQPNKVLVALGGVPLRTILNLPKQGVLVKDFHGTVNRDPTNRFWVVPTFHPSHIQRGAFNLLGVQSFDLQVALDVVRDGFEPEEVDLILDPPIQWFGDWADALIAEIERDPEGVWLAIDIETPDKAKQSDEGELLIKEARSYHITRVNLCSNIGQGITVQFTGPYIAIIRRLLATRGVKVFWNAQGYDVPRLIFHDCPPKGPIFDAMWMWHRLQSDTPRGLGFVSPFYCPRLPPWKHLSGTEPILYAAHDGVRTLRIGMGVAQSLRDAGMWDVPYYRHTFLVDTRAFNQSEEVGLLVNQPKLIEFTANLEKHHERLYSEIQQIVPIELHPLVPKNGLKSWPEEKDGTPEAGIIEMLVVAPVQKCLACGELQISKTHRCKIPGATPNVQIVDAQVPRFYRREPFNPGSPPQVMTYIRHRHHKPGKDKRTKKDSTNKDTIHRLAKTTSDPFYPRLLDIRACDKVKNTYAIGTMKKLGLVQGAEPDPRSVKDGRLHAITTHKPSTGRISMQNPNLTNVVADKAASFTAGFREVLEAEKGSYLIEADFSGIEAVETGWFMGDPQYIRLAKLGVHSFVASHAIHRPADISWSDDDLRAYFKEIKASHPEEYDRSKRCVHGKNYGLTVRGMVLQFPETFPTESVARKMEEIYFSVAPKLPTWQAEVRDFAHKHHYLGGKIDSTGYNPTPGFHPFGYKHWYFNVISYKPIKGVAPRGALVVRMGNRNFQVVLGEDGKRCVAFFPQSTAAGVINEAILELFDPDQESFIGEEFHGKTPLRAMIHDSLLLEVPAHRVEQVIEKLRLAMERPIEEQPLPPEWGIGSHLTIGVEVKVGKNWAHYNLDESKGKVNPEGMRLFDPSLLPSLAGDRVIPIDEYDEDLPELLDPDEMPPVQGTGEVA